MARIASFDSVSSPPTTVTVRSATAVNVSTLNDLIDEARTSATNLGDPSALLALVQAIASVRPLAACTQPLASGRAHSLLCVPLRHPHTQTLNDPDGTLTPEELSELQLQLSEAVNLAYTLTTDLDATTTSALIGALKAVTDSAATLDDELFDLLLALVQGLAGTAVDAGNQFLAIVAVMLQKRGVKSATDSTVLTDSLKELALAVLEEAVCGESVPAMSALGMELLASYQASFAGQSLGVTGDVELDFGNFTDFGTTADGEPICKKSQIVGQDTTPFQPPEDTKYK